jgi:hypothetical protein
LLAGEVFFLPYKGSSKSINPMCFLMPFIFVISTAIKASEQKDNCNNQEFTGLNSLVKAMDFSPRL